jgi:tetratricopeptide (TPR) repeat protein
MVGTLFRLTAGIRLDAAALIVAVAVTGCARERPTDYDVELGQIDRELASLKADASAAPLQVAYQHYRRASLSGLPADAEAADDSVERAIRLLGPTSDLCLLKANLDAREHRWADAQRTLARAPDLDGSPQGRLMRADFDLQDGRYAQARSAYAEALRRDRTWDGLARLAYLTALTGDLSGADALYAEAEEEITAKDMRAYAWVLLQRGLLQFSHGRYAEALAHYTRARRAYSGYWLVDDYLAELLAAQGRFDEAEAMYARIAERVPRPDLQQRLGDLYAFMGDLPRAARWHDAALDGYLKSAARGEVQYFHHLAAFYTDVRPNGTEAVKWARRDLALRGGYAALDAMAWALFREGRVAEARELMARALASGVQDAHVDAHAAEINFAAGQPEEGRRLLARAAATNPGYENFHIHR